VTSERLAALATLTMLPGQAERVSQAEQRPGGRKDDQCEKNKFGGNTGPLALGVAFAEKAERAQARGNIRIKQLTIPPNAA
jgi:hypothetical protein